jgi:hypothetical protein
MLNSPILDAAIGLAFVFLLFSLLVSAACELLAGLFKWRAANLWDGLEHLLQSEDARQRLFNHPLIRGLATHPAPAATNVASPATAGRVRALMRPEWLDKLRALVQPILSALRLSHDADVAHLPSYIPPRSFALALIDVVRDPHAFEKGVRDSLDTLIDRATTDPIGFAQSLDVELQKLEAPEGQPPTPAQAQIANLRARLTATPAQAVNALTASVQQAIATLQANNPQAVRAVDAWLESVGTPAGPVAWPVMCAQLSSAVAQIASPDQRVQEVRKALEGILNGLTAGRTDQIVGELKTLMNQSQNVRHALENAGGNLKDLARSLSPLLDEAAGDIDRFRRNVEIWFNDGMDRVAGAYKRHTMGWQAAIGFSFAVLLNVDALVITRTLYRDPVLRQSLASEAQAYVNQPSAFVPRHGLEFPGGTVDSAQLKVTLSSDNLSPDRPLTATVTVPGENADRTVRLDAQTPNLVFDCELPPATGVDVKKWKPSLECPVLKGAQTVPVYAGLTADPTSESVASFRVGSAPDPAALKSVDVSVVAKPTAGGQFDALRTQINTLGLPIGWRLCADTTSTLATPLLWCGSNAGWSALGFLGMLFGWMITAAAVSLGAPFWFDILKRFVSIRSAGKAPEEAPLKPKAVQQPLAPGEPEKERRTP